MPFVEGIRGPDPVRYCDRCQVFTLQLVGQWYEDPDLRKQGLPSEYSHIGPLCPVCEDEESRGEPFGTSVDGVRRESAAA